MRCEEVIRELSTPTGRHEPAQVAGHLAGCPRCAAWAERSERLDRLWAATRPADPPAFEFDRLWAGVTASLESGVEPEFGIEPEVGEDRHLVAAPRRGFRWGGVVGVLAAAAAVLIAGLLTFRPRPPVPDGPHDAPIEVVKLESLEIPTGEYALYHIDDSDLEVRAPVEASETESIPASVIVFNYMESPNDPESVW